MIPNDAPTPQVDIVTAKTNIESRRLANISKNRQKLPNLI